MVAQWPLVGRAEELDWLLESTTAAAPGVLLAGSAGVGKTRLISETVARWRARGRECRWFVATRSAGSVPLGVFAEIAETSEVDPLRRIRDVVAAVSAPAAGGRVLVVVDDAHLLDEQSALVINQVVRLRQASVLLAVRSGETPPDAVSGLWKDQLLGRLDLQPFSREVIAQLAAGVLGGPVESSTATALWRYTRGNVLYLRHLIDGERSAERLTRRAGVWVWDGRPGVSVPLADLVQASIARQPESVLSVVDVLAVADPLEVDVLCALTDPAAVEHARRAGLVTFDLDVAPALARLTHPLLGDVRRAHTTPARLRTLRGRVAAALETSGATKSLIQAVRRAVLRCESDQPPNAEMCGQAAVAALKLTDPLTAQRLACHAVEAGGGRNALLLHASALAHCARYDEALAVNAAQRRDAGSEYERVLLTLNRAAILTTKDDSAAARELAAIESAATACGLRRPYDAVAAWAATAQDQLTTGAEAATAALNAEGWFNEFFELFALAALVSAKAGLGRYEEMTAPAERGYDLAYSTTGSSTFSFLIGIYHIDGCYTGGYLEAATELAERLNRAPGDFPIAFTYRALYTGAAALGRGDLTTARARCRESLAITPSAESLWVSRLAILNLTIATAMTGDAETANALLAQYQPLGRHPGDDRLTYTHLRARAWASAAVGITSHATTLETEAATIAQTNHQPAHEVLARQTATQFGDPTHAERLSELTTVVQGPRVIAAAHHATALRNGDPAGLAEAARMYEQFGDRIAAADAASQAATLFRRNGCRGAALTATATAHRLASATGAHTPALRANTTTDPLSARQREVIALVAAGLTNQQIADRLVMSIRTVEGHLFRASQKTGINTRTGLAAALDTTHH
ncbi:DNA-binding CsgD family transcriptional regulator [Nocardia kruczakiae]|uniref:DNA-binding CsgD family transcriptional regulator n=1 Tax=Nocardia kruczakiae TaxID=261477 RepID=A0ABU1XSV8_9NOCA|nr:LuxR C-terminal-related transcriptional regulator [Nocardia kruczakiae]MDR7173067.1 DNA-binding CsgD family transcriptional regulator [Nocardia kruczakiae]